MEGNKNIGVKWSGIPAKPFLHQVGKWIQETSRPWPNTMEEWLRAAETYRLATYRWN